MVEFVESKEDQVADCCINVIGVEKMSTFYHVLRLLLLPICCLVAAYCMSHIFTVIIARYIAPRYHTLIDQTSTTYLFIYIFWQLWARLSADSLSSLSICYESNTELSLEDKYMTIYYFHSIHYLIASTATGSLIIIITALIALIARKQQLIVAYNYPIL